jgi:integrase
MILLLDVAEGKERGRRRAFATLNAEKLTPDALHALMQHRSYSTTQRYINVVRQLDTAVAQLHVPEVLKVTKA